MRHRQRSLRVDSLYIFSAVLLWACSQASGHVGRQQPIALSDNGRNLLGRVANTDRSSAEAAEQLSAADAYSGKLLEDRIFPALLPPSVQTVLWMGCSPATAATLVRLGLKKLTVTTVDPRPELASFAPGGLHIISPYANAATQLQRQSIDLVVIMGTSAEATAQDLRGALTTAEHALRQGGWLVMGRLAAKDQLGWGCLEPGFREALPEGLDPQVELDDGSWRFHICQRMDAEPPAGLEVKDVVVHQAAGAAEHLHAQAAGAGALASTVEQADRPKHKYDPGRAYVKFGKALLETMSADSVTSGSEDHERQHTTMQSLVEHSSSDTARPDKPDDNKPTRPKHSTRSTDPPPRSKSVEELADEAEMREAAEEEAALEAATSEASKESSAKPDTEASQLASRSSDSDEANSSGVHESSSHKHRASSSNRAAKPAAVHHSRRVHLPASKLGANPRTYGHSR